MGIVRPFPKQRKGTGGQTLYAVCLIGWEGPRPRHFGDNQGSWPFKIASCKVVLGGKHEDRKRKVQDAAARSDLESPHTPIIVHEYVFVPTETHAKRLKDALDDVLLGEQERHTNDAARHRWRDCLNCFEPGDNQDRARWWGEVVLAAQEIVRYCAADFPVYDDDEF